MVLTSDVVKVTLVELQTVYGVEDLEDLVEMILVSAHNTRAFSKAMKKD